MLSQKILIIEDEKDLREALHTSLENAGYTVSTAVDGEDGLTQALQVKPDLILLDIGMPKMNGHQVLNELRRDSWGKTVSVLLLTNADDPANIIRGVGLRGNDYIIKTQVSLSDVVQRVKQYLGGYHD
jgi:two-component system, OmpR family, alkaline phosphatase synthesis response regulator PhoP